MTTVPASGTLARGVHRLPVRVYYEDTDSSGIAYHASYLRWFERGRTEMRRTIGITHTEPETAAAGYFAVASMDIVWHRPARLDDALIIESRVTRLRAAAVVLKQVVVHPDASLCTASVTAALLCPEGRPRRLPKGWHDQFLALQHEAETA
ncbi:tol-pal system-associated acyl-CoA thioesterase [Polymorphobacter multimanifer]|uniref:YbgC/FadM family acyl-CoA thioesterase n=1 Tax=Polymorphobacter multimanifer TaxID=1070431 RepID=UPI001664B2C5|nr:YbgC/FadM family acyl-CoA thioesterase [Polymorphobacter multimanifer]GGI79089.1 tol-pal system-associated acyl-CoA thioesterase [Polymorphobacter multimanifer]